MDATANASRRSWRELDICPLYELYLLRWELKLQQDLGHSILDMLKGLSSAAVQVRPSALRLVCVAQLLPERAGLHGLRHPRHSGHVARRAGECE